MSERRTNSVNHKAKKGSRNMDDQGNGRLRFGENISIKTVHTL